MKMPNNNHEFIWPAYDLWRILKEVGPTWHSKNPHWYCVETSHIILYEAPTQFFHITQS